MTVSVTLIDKETQKTLTKKFSAEGALNRLNEKFGDVYHRSEIGVLNLIEDDGQLAYLCAENDEVDILGGPIGLDIVARRNKLSVIHCR